MMRTAVLQAPRRFEVAERPTPRPGRGAALVRVAATAVCHTDLSIYTGQHPGVRYPVVLGHDATGVVHTRVAELAGAGRAGAVMRTVIKRGLARCMLAGAADDPSRAGVVVAALALT